MLQDALDEAVDAMGRFGRSYPIWLDEPAGHEVVSAVELLDPRVLGRYFERSIAEWTDDPGEEDVRAAASRFMRRYCGSLIAAALVPLAHGLAVDTSVIRVSLVVRTDMPMGVVLDADGVVMSCEQRPILLPMASRPVDSVDELRAHAFGSLIPGNIGPAIAKVVALARIPAATLWATVAEQVDLMVDSASGRASPQVLAALEADREVLLWAERLPGVDDPNPLLGLLRWEESDDPVFSSPRQVRPPNVCCVCFVVEGRGMYCRNCGLVSAEERHEMWREWRAMVAAEERGTSSPSPGDMTPRS